MKYLNHIVVACPLCWRHISVSLGWSLCIFYSSLENIVYLLFCLFCFVWTWACFFKTPARVECHLINGGYNSWKRSQCFPVGFIYILRAACSPHFYSLTHSPLSLLVCFTVSLPRRLALSPSSNQLKQTVASASCPSGALRPPLPVRVISHEPTHCVHFLLARPGKQSWRGKWSKARRNMEVGGLTEPHALTHPYQFSLNRFVGGEDTPIRCWQCSHHWPSRFLQKPTIFNIVIQTLRRNKKFSDHLTPSAQDHGAHHNLRKTHDSNPTLEISLWLSSLFKNCLVWGQLKMKALYTFNSQNV